MLGSLILYLKGMRTTMFQLSGFYSMQVGASWCTKPEVGSGCTGNHRTQNRSSTEFAAMVEGKGCNAKVASARWMNSASTNIRGKSLALCVADSLL